MHLNRKVIAVVSDLFFASKITEAAKRTGISLEYVTNEEDLLQKARNHPALIIFDLNFDAIQPLGLIEKLKSDPELKHVRLLGYLSHVQVELKTKAQESGCDVVMPRSAFSLNLPGILSELDQGLQLP